MWLKPLLFALAIPPVALVFLALLGLVLQLRYARLGRIVVWCGVLGLLLLSMPAVGRWLLVGLEDGLPLTPPADQPPQAIVILSGDLARSQGTVPRYAVGPMTLERVLAGAALARRTGLPILVSGGSLRASDPSLAAVMADTLRVDLGVPAHWVERQSLDTWQNATMSAAILRAEGIRSVYVVTHAWHMRRAVIAFANAGLAVTAAPTRSERQPTLHPVEFVPSVEGWRISYFAMHEWIGIGWYLVR